MSKKRLKPQDRPGLPRQHLHAVVELPPWPDDFFVEAPIGADPAPFFRQIEYPETLKSVCVLEWVLDSNRGRADFYALEKRSRDWVLWNNVPAGLVDDKPHVELMAHALDGGSKVSDHTAASLLLRVSLATDREYRGIGRPTAIIQTGLLSVAELSAIFREVWPAPR